MIKTLSKGTKLGDAASYESAEAVKSGTQVNCLLGRFGFKPPVSKHSCFGLSSP
jgi:hypothetical protein